MTIEELLKRLNDKPEHKRFWGGRVTIEPAGPGLHEAYTLADRGPTVTEAIGRAGFEVVGSETCDYGDDDCPKIINVIRFKGGGRG